jgi:multiple sugar transport system substrate-binding protein
MRKLMLVLSILVVASMLLAACTTPAPATQVATDSATEAATDAATAAPASGKIQVRWFVGLGTGTQPDQITVQEEVTADFNASQDAIELVLEVVPYDSARDTLATQIASGNGPDIIGPVGWGGSNFFYGQYLDMTDAIAATGFDTSIFSDELLKYYQTEEGQVGLPFAVYPAAMYYVPAMFDEAGLNYPPAEYGKPYVMPDGTEKPWDWNTVAEIAKLMTVDVNGKNATEAGFDRTQIVQVGYIPQWSHAMTEAGFWGDGGAAAFYDPVTLEAHIPDWAKAAWKFHYDGMWGEQPFIATGALAGSPEFGGGNVFNSGKAAMANTQFWYTCCLADFAAAGNEFQLAVLPISPLDGKVHGRLDADTFRIWKGTPHPNEAFTVVAYLITEGALKLAPIYGALPAIKEQQQAFLDKQSETYPFVTSWQPMIDGLAYPDIPSNEGYMPNYNESWNRVGTFGDLMANTEGLDLDAEIATLEADLTVIFQKK